jgi:phosphoglycolate phosphatase
MYSVILFDLDGTLNDSCKGITQSVQYALRHWGIEAELQDLLGFIGPPLTWSFPNLFGIKEEEVPLAIEKYREHYNAHGMLEGAIYSGIYEMLSTLKEQGFRLAVATSKPEMYVAPILNHFSLIEYFEEAAGSPPDESGGKAEVIADVLHRLGDPDKSTVLMVGDREHDIEGAKTNGVDSVGVLWGYGSPEEHKAHGATHIVATPQDLTQLLLSQK